MLYEGDRCINVYEMFCGVANVLKFFAVEFHIVFSCPFCCIGCQFMHIFSTKYCSLSTRRSLMALQHSWLMTTSCNPVRSTRSSHKVNLLVVPHQKSNKYSEKAFAVVGPRLWNKLFKDKLRGCNSVDTFKKKLKLCSSKNTINIYYIALCFVDFFVIM